MVAKRNHMLDTRPPLSLRYAAWCKAMAIEPPMRDVSEGALLMLHNLAIHDR